ncbi:MAG: hypothetical protein OEU46_06440 [Alphaproteobacteria bacterium]|nr:hypothetical protein [Alphaproteobacteria bacterium]
MTKIDLSINDESRDVDIDPSTPLMVVSQANVKQSPKCGATAFLGRQLTPLGQRG